MGFAGFFGVPISYRRFGDEANSAQCPAPLKPLYQIEESVHCHDHQETKRALGKNRAGRSWRKLWKQFQVFFSGKFLVRGILGVLLWNQPGLLVDRQSCSAPLADSNWSIAPMRSTTGPRYSWAFEYRIDVRRTSRPGDRLAQEPRSHHQLCPVGGLCGHESETSNNHSGRSRLWCLWRTLRRGQCPGGCSDSEQSARAAPLERGRD